MSCRAEGAAGWVWRGQTAAPAGARCPQQRPDGQPGALGQAGAAAVGMGTGRKPRVWEQGQGEKVCLGSGIAPTTYIQSKAILS